MRHTFAASSRMNSSGVARRRPGEAVATTANIKFYGGGVSEANFLRDLSTMIGDHDVEKWSRSSGRGGSSRSQSWSREAILSVAELQSLPRGRAVLLSSGSPAALLQTVPWMEGPHAAAITESLDGAGAGTGSVAVSW